MKSAITITCIIACVVIVGFISSKYGSIKANTRNAAEATSQGWHLLVRSGTNTVPATDLATCASTTCGYSKLLRIWIALDAFTIDEKNCRSPEMDTIFSQNEIIHHIILDTNPKLQWYLPFLRGVFDFEQIRFEDYLLMRIRCKDAIDDSTHADNPNLSNFGFSVDQQKLALERFFDLEKQNIPNSVQFAHETCKSNMLNYLIRRTRVSANVDHWICIEGAYFLAANQSKFWSKRSPK